MPVTVLENDRGFQWGMEYANQVYNRIQDYAKNQKNLMTQQKIEQSRAATSQIESLKGAFETGLQHADLQTRAYWKDFYDTLNARTVQPMDDAYTGTMKTDTYLEPNQGNKVGNPYGYK